MLLDKKINAGLQVICGELAAREFPGYGGSESDREVETYTITAV